MIDINIKRLFKLSPDGSKINPITVSLGTRNFKKLGIINNIYDVDFEPLFTSHCDISFSVYKYVNGVKCNYWNDIRQNSLIYIEEFKEWFQLTYKIDDGGKVTKKNITAMSLCEAELSQKTIEAEINTDIDFKRTEYKPSIFYDKNNPEFSILDRLFNDTGYTIKYVAPTLYKLQRSFSITSGTKLYDFLVNNLAKEIGCLFQFDSKTRGVYVYDLMYTCNNCGYRSEDEFDECPECESTDVSKAYGENINVLVDKDTIGTAINLECNMDNVKNCFEIKGGDDNINASIIGCNPSGSNVIYYFNEDTLADMGKSSPTLIEKLNSYNDEINFYMKTSNIELDDNLVSQYNNIISNVKTLYSDLKYNSINNPVKTYPTLSYVQNDTMDFATYLKTEMMPTFPDNNKKAKDELDMLNETNLSPVAVDDLSEDKTGSMINNAILEIAKVIIDTAYFDVEIIGYSFNHDTKIWSGKFRVSSLTDEKDVAENESNINITINEDVYTYCKQQVDKIFKLKSDNGLCAIYDCTDEDLPNEVKKYCSERLLSYYTAYKTGLGILLEQGVKSGDVAYSLYKSYLNREKIIENEYTLRESQIEIINSLYKAITNTKEVINNKMNLYNWLGNDAELFESYKREDVITNENYKSDGLSNAEMIDKALELTKVMKAEIIKSGTKQYSITDSIENILLIKDSNGKQAFAPILDKFTLGNFIRYKIDDKIYKMRLLGMSYKYGNDSTIGITFSDVALNRHSCGVNDASKTVLDTVMTIGTSYNYYAKQAEQGKDANEKLLSLSKNGINTSEFNVYTGDEKDIVWDDNGLLLRKYNTQKNDFDPEQILLGRKSISFTQDNWNSPCIVLGEQTYTLNGINYTDYGLATNFVFSGIIIGGQQYSSNYTTDGTKVTKGSYINWESGDFDIGAGKLEFDSSTNTLSVSGSIYAQDGMIGNWKLTNDKLYNSIEYGSNSSVGIGLLNTLPAFWAGTDYKVDWDGKLTAKNVDISGSITATNGTIASFTIGDKYLQSANQVVGFGTTTDWAFWAGYDTSTKKANFQVKQNGKLIANDVEISGTINSNDGHIGGWIIGDNYIESNSAVYNGKYYKVYLGGFNDITCSPADRWVLSVQTSDDNSTFYQKFLVLGNGDGYFANLAVDDITMAGKIEAGGTLHTTKLAVFDNGISLKNNEGITAYYNDTNAVHFSGQDLVTIKNWFISQKILD